MSENLGQSGIDLRTINITVQMPRVEGRAFAPFVTVPVDYELLSLVRAEGGDMIEFIESQMRPHIEYLLEVHESGEQPGD